MCTPLTQSFWFHLEGQSEEDAHEIKIAVDNTTSVSTLYSAIINANLWHIQKLSDIEEIKLKDQILKPRTKLISLKIVDTDTFVVRILTKKVENFLEDENFGEKDKEEKLDKGDETGNDGKEEKSNKENEKEEKSNKENEKEEEKKEEKKEPVYKSFSISRKKEGDTVEISLTITDKELRSYLSERTGFDALYCTPAVIGAHELYSQMERIKDDFQNVSDNVKEIISFLETEFCTTEEQIKGMLEDGRISYGFLYNLFSRGKHVVGYDEDTRDPIGAEVMDCRYFTSMTGKLFLLEARVVKSDGTKFFLCPHSFYIPYFVGTKKLTSLPVRPLDEDTRKILIERGKLFELYGKDHHYLTYKGVMLWRGWLTLRYRADGRCMVDIKTFCHQNPNNEYSRMERSSRDDSWDTIPEKELWKAWPFVAGFSFVSKQWGELCVSSLGPVIFDNNAFAQLVLPEKKKSLIKALVQYQSTTFNDIITGKGGGCIFLLHGSPGVGKTLTAESIAELLRRPLYSVGVGELGTTTKNLETKLKDILQVASTWNAVVLIDEADIFLEKRTEQDVHRNAMVGIFLRMLEYHQGVLFLTTNRVTTFDPAFHSRISIALKYKDLEKSERLKVWENLLHAAEIKGIDLEVVSEKDLNGRQIKNAIRLAQALAKSTESTVSMEHVMETIKISEQFKKDIEESVIFEKVKEEIHIEKEKKEKSILRNSIGTEKQ